MRYLLLSLVIVANAACTSMKTVKVPDPEVAVQQISVGDTVQIVKADGDKLKFKVTAIDDEFLSGVVKSPGRTKDVRVAIKDVRLVSISRVDPGPGLSAAAIAGAVTVIAFALICGYSGC